MSLINDALKRASETTKKQTGDPPPSVTLKPVDYAVRPNPAFRILVVLMLLTAVAFAAWFLSKWQEHSAASMRLHIVTNSAPPSAVPANPASPQLTDKPSIRVSTNFVTRGDLKIASTPPAGRAGPEPENLGRATPASPPKTEPSGTETNVIAPEGASTTPEATNSFPTLKLQSIVYRLSKPAVVINGEMLYTGDTIKEARIVKIERLAVTVEWRGQTNTLSLPRL